MQAIEFSTTVKNGRIEIPRQYLSQLQKPVRVILLVEEDQDEDTNFIDQLLTNPLQVKNFQPLSREEIYAR